MDNTCEQICGSIGEDQSIVSRTQLFIAENNWLGLLIAIAIIGLWGSSLILLLPLSIAQAPWIWLIFAILCRTFFQTGLFILAHDAMHGSLVHHHRTINAWMGKIAVWLYAFLSYEQCYTNHWKHHCYPTQSADPDFHDGIHSHPILWYLKFLRQYLTARQMMLLLSYWGLIFIGLHQRLGISPISFFLFWIVPLIFSSIQLFYFGTYLPHRGQQTEHSHCAHSSSYPVWLSFLTCYHFGYHWEHHAFPKIPWYQLPDIRFRHHFKKSAPTF